MIFRPALLSHPTHELSPHEHQLSQDVLEFLIAHQDWFMLDIPPPPSSITVNSKSGAPVVGGLNEQVDIVPSSDDDQPGGWKLVDKDAAGIRKITRRRTTTERSSGALSFVCAMLCCLVFAQRVFSVHPPFTLPVVLSHRCFCTLNFKQRSLLKLDSGRAKAGEGGDLSPVLETPPSRSGSLSGATVSRRRTLPTKSRAATDTSNVSSDEGQTKVLKKQKRSSMQPSKRTHSSQPTPYG